MVFTLTDVTKSDTVSELSTLAVSEILLNLAACWWP